MTISVAIPAYNAAATISATLQTVFQQSVSPIEVLVMDDGSSDATATILATYRDRIHVLRQPNRGVAAARNELCRQAKGDLIAFLDADDLWHPSHLREHLSLVCQYPAAAAYFTYHHDFKGAGGFEWPNEPAEMEARSRIIPPTEFVRECNRAPMNFLMSSSSLPRNTLRNLAGTPFLFSGGEDTYFHHRLALHGPVAHLSKRTVAYRITPSSLSADRLKTERQVVKSMQALAPDFRTSLNKDLSRAFYRAFAARVRLLGRLLMGTRDTAGARKQFWDSIGVCPTPKSMIKSFAYIAISYLPKFLQPQWPASRRRTSEY